jgi:hypothetical protein
MEVLRAARFASEGIRVQDLLRAGPEVGLVRVRHGGYARALAEDVEGRHRQLVAATYPLLGERTVLSHGSAALLHGLPVWGSLLDVVSATRSEGGHGRRGRYLHVRLAELDVSEIADVDGHRCTSLERTALDVARVVTYERAVAVLDAALRMGASRSILDDMAARARGRTGTASAARALHFADPRSESVGESVSRVRIARAGLPVPDLQVNLYDDHGVWIARSDFAWREQRVIGEFDGRVKYRGSVEEVTDTVMREKSREQAIRDAGWWVVRWSWHDLADAAAFRRRLETALRRPAG